MMLVCDVRKGGCRVGVLSRSGQRWLRSAERDPLALLPRALALSGGKPTHVALARYAPGSADAPTWSGLRAGLAFAGSVAFALDVPAVDVEVSGAKAMPPRALAAAAVLAARAAGPAAPRFLAASYDGQPHITTPKV